MKKEQEKEEQNGTGGTWVELKEQVKVLQSLDLDPSSNAIMIEYQEWMSKRSNEWDQNMEEAIMNGIVSGKWYPQDGYAKMEKTGDLWGCGRYAKKMGKNTIQDSTEKDYADV